MSSEPLYNVGLVCKEHAPKPGKYKSCEPAKLVGEMVKLGFKVNHPVTLADTLEHMWVRVSSVITPGTYPSGEELIGVLENDPIMLCEYENGDEVAFKVEEIEDVYIDLDS